MTSPGAQPLTIPTPAPPPASAAPARPAAAEEQRPFVNWVELLVVVVIIGVLAALLLPPTGHARPVRGLRCMNNLKQLWTMQANYMAGPWGGRDHRMPPATGSDFWTCLTRTTPPLIDATITADIFDCPLSPTRGDAAHCEYRGPASDVNLYADDDPVGACDHGDEGIVVLRKSGDVMLYKRNDPVAVAALEKTRP